jgi:O-antigen ligase
MVLEMIRVKTFKFSLPAGILLLTTVGVSLLLIFSVIQGEGTSLSEKMSRVFTEKHYLEYKSADGNRIEYTTDGLASILQNPLLGVGPGNFVLISQSNWKPGYLWTESGHNILLDIFVENGVLAGVFFILIIYQFLKQASRNVFFFMALALLFNFLTDYTYRIFSFFLLFYILQGLALNLPKSTRRGR